MAEEGFRVTLNVYDLSQGLARQLSVTFLGKAIEAIWHTGVVVYGNEYYFGGGIQHTPAGTTPYGTPMRVVDLGVTHVTKDVFESYLNEISPRYTAETYSLLTHNCNNFSNEVAQFLVGTGIPDYILQLPNEVMSSPMGALMLPMIQNLESTLKSGAVPQVPQFRPSPSPAPVSLQPVPHSLHTSSHGSIFRGDYRNATNGTTGKPGESNVGDAAVKPAAAQQKPGVKSIAGHVLGDARTKVQDEITKEFASIMATGTMPASEAAALATRRVMQRYGHIDVSQS